MGSPNSHGSSMPIVQNYTSSSAIQTSPLSSLGQTTAVTDDRAIAMNTGVSRTTTTTTASATATLIADDRLTFTTHDAGAIPKVLIPVSIAGWLLFGIICILCINGRGRLGRWVPEWYLDSEGTVRDKAAVVLWWLAVMVLWPVILPVLLLKKIAGGLKRRLEDRKWGKDERVLWPKERERTEEA